MSRIQEFDYSVDLMKALLWQYNDAENLQKLLELKNEWYIKNQTEFWSNWYNDVFNLKTANAFGLSVWAIILDIPITVQVGPSAPDKPTWGYGEFNKNFENGNFSRSRGGALSLTVEQSRTVLRLRYFQITSRGTVPEINRFLKLLFKDLGPIYVRDNLDMTMTYVFGFQPSSQLLFVLERYDILPRPAGVAVDSVVELIQYWGFEPFRENFDNGNFGES